MWKYDTNVVDIVFLRVLRFHSNCRSYVLSHARDYINLEILWNCCEFLLCFLLYWYIFSFIFLRYHCFIIISMSFSFSQHARWSWMCRRIRSKNKRKRWWSSMNLSINTWDYDFITYQPTGWMISYKSKSSVADHTFNWFLVNPCGHVL